MFDAKSPRDRLPCFLKTLVETLVYREIETNCGILRRRVGWDSTWLAWGICRNAHRVIRGGSWDNSARNCRAAYRNRRRPDNRNGNRGFRVCLFPGTKVDRSRDHHRTTQIPELPTSVGGQNLGKPLTGVKIGRNANSTRWRTRSTRHQFPSFSANQTDGGTIADDTETKFGPSTFGGPRNDA